MAKDSRIIKTGLFGKKNKDILDSVIGQWSDGIWENTPQMAKYWKFADVDMPNGEVLLEIDLDRTDGSHWNGFYGLPDDKVKEIFGRYVKAIVKQELDDGLDGNWKRDCTAECDYLTRDDNTPITVQDAYYAYEVLKGRNVGKHQEYSDIKETLEAEGADASEANDAIKALFKQMVDDQSCCLLDGSDRGVEYRDQYDTKVFYLAGKLYFTFSKEDVEDEESLLDLAEKITSYGPATISSSSDRIKFVLVLPENKAIEAVKDFFEVD